MARPRKYNVNIPGLSCYTDARTKKVYWRYKHPITGKFHGLGTDEAEAKAIASEANIRLEEQQIHQLLKVRDEINKSRSKGISVLSWVERYDAYQLERLNSGEIKINTLKQKAAPLKAFVAAFGTKNIDEVSVRDVATLLDEYKERGQNRMAQIVRMVLIDLYKEAQHAGEVPPGFNPAEATRMPKNKVQRERLTLDEWQEIFSVAADMPRYVQNSMLLALITGQRLGDVANMQFKDIWDGMLHVVQSKTGAKLAIPLKLRCDALNLSLEDVVNRCRDRVLSKYLVHHFHGSSQCVRGDRVRDNTITSAFSAARDKTGLEWSNGTPPTFHEQRSLSERLYREQGIDTQKLLGHKNQAQTDKYHDDRGKEWSVIAV
ncbi:MULTISPECIES: site-specific integrase [unclassified Tatumella]|uniref:site-specific integrase n=1 Tax=unclassified Tatumella TaxID=2649542 RepID=UPI001BB07749|nr:MULTISPECIES: site-specific integrase [unclassified Tatumella]MBS0877615.1 phage integrase Arm DNA-binding domain-containing protein [Tatumella sp. JGM82]MBS0891320.1 phage integrase Arm DNA-binding domain-containing protein [Tatumella sp. JGM94]MBS0902147.1 phage integrase Arm DNA-binding domain-containing protein [Tatumella sp. JGM100]